MTFAINGRVAVFAFIHVPRTAGRWTVEACKRAGLTVKRCGSQHEGFQAAEAHAPRRAMFFSICRHPATWMRSWYVSTRDGGWLGWHNHTNCLMDFKAETFEQFVDNYCRAAPGLMTDIWAGYIRETKPIYILRHENIADDLIEMLDAMSVPFSRDKILTTDSEQFKSKDVNPISLKAYHSLFKTDPKLYQRFGYKERPDG